MKDNDIMRQARLLRPELSTLLIDKADRAHFDQLIADAELGKISPTKLLQKLNSQSATRKWLKLRLSKHHVSKFAIKDSKIQCSNASAKYVISASGLVPRQAYATLSINSLLYMGEPKPQFKPLPGDIPAQPGSVYVCPVMGCTFRWTRQRVGKQPPKCKKHNRSLVPKS